eukprot:scaffold81960_cov21-Prasinocladus_malaysianus.AAC.3
MRRSFIAILLCVPKVEVSAVGCPGSRSDAVLLDVEGKRWGDFKPMLADAVIEHLRPIQARYVEVRKEPGYLDEVLQRGAESAEKTANWTLDNCRDAMGL